MIAWGWTRARREVCLVSGRVAAVAGAVVCGCNDPLSAAGKYKAAFRYSGEIPSFVLCEVLCNIQPACITDIAMRRKAWNTLKKKKKKGKKKEQACFSVLPAWKDGGMLVIALNSGAVFTLDVTQCSFSCMYCIANLDLLSLFLLAGLLSGFAVVGETLTVVFWSLHLFTCASASLSVARASAWRARARKITPVPVPERKQPCDRFEFGAVCKPKCFLAGVQPDGKDLPLSPSFLFFFEQRGCLLPARTGTSRWLGVLEFLLQLLLLADGKMAPPDP